MNETLKCSMSATVSVGKHAAKCLTLVSLVAQALCGQGRLDFSLLPLLSVDGALLPLFPVNRICMGLVLLE